MQPQGTLKVKKGSKRGESLKKMWQWKQSQRDAVFLADEGESHTNSGSTEGTKKEEPTPKHIIIKMTNIKNKETILRTAKQKQSVT